jgi:hypothetical protein
VERLTAKFTKGLTAKGMKGVKESLGELTAKDMKGVKLIN